MCGCMCDIDRARVKGVCGKKEKIVIVIVMRKVYEKYLVDSQVQVQDPNNFHG